MKIAFFCRNPLGDGINSLVLSQNLYNHGFQIDTYHDHLKAMQNWVPHLPIFPYPKVEEIPKILKRYDFFIAVWDKKTDFVMHFIPEAKKLFPEKIRVIYLYSSKNIVREPYYEDCLVDPFKPVAENFELFCRRILSFSKTERKIQWKVPENLVFQKHPRRIVLHPTVSGPASGGWPKQKFMALADYLQKIGYEVVLIPGIRDQADWEDVFFEKAYFATFDELARYLYESGYLVGSDSGPGHLASALGLPTLTICRRKAHAKLWSPSFAPNVTVTPYPFVPNMRGLRLRDRHWQKFITLGMAKRGFQKLLQENKSLL